MSASDIPSAGTTDRFRPSNPTPSFTLIPPHPLPHPARPQLRIITSLPPPIIRAIPVRHPALIKSAPLVLHPSNKVGDEAIKRSHREAGITAGGGVVIQIHSPQAQAPHPPATGHKRRLSFKFKSLFSHLHLHPRREQLLEADEKLAPDRPHRSPGTASFLVSRHPDVDFPPYAASSARFSPVSETSVENLQLDVPSSPRSSCSAGKPAVQTHLLSVGMDISHFSTPSTMRSTSSSGVLEGVTSRSPSSRRAGEVGARILPLDGRVRQCGSMPDLREICSA